MLEKNTRIKIRSAKASAKQVNFRKEVTWL
jgi:hypothetical protein